MKLMQVVPEKYRLHAHHWLILHGRYVCTAGRPSLNARRASSPISANGRGRR